MLVNYSREHFELKLYNYKLSFNKKKKNYLFIILNKKCIRNFIRHKVCLAHR